MQATTQRNDLRDEVWDHLLANPDGLTINDLVMFSGQTKRHIQRAIRDLRLLLGDGDDINVPCVPQGKGEQWLYTIEAGMNEGTRRWTNNRMDDAEARLHTIRAMAESAMHFTSGAKEDRVRARQIERSLRHLIEDLDALIESA